MKHIRCLRPMCRMCLPIAIVVWLMISAVVCVAAEEATPWGVVPISDTAAESETTAKPHNATSVGVSDTTSQTGRSTPVAVSYGLRVLAAREEMVLSGLCGNEISFTAEDIARAMNLSELKYITVQELPSPGDGTLFVGAVGAAEGQVISAVSLSLMSFAAANDEEPCEATMKFTVNGSDYAITCRLCLLDSLNYTPTVSLAPAISLNIETYRNLPTAGTFSAYDPEGDEVTFEIVRYASHGRVTLTDRHTGAYTYTPDSGYTGRDSFDYVVRDRYGNYSTSATVNVQVTARPTSVAYADIDGEEQAGAILTVSVLGLMNGTRVGNECYFKPTEGMSRAEFLATAMQAAGITAADVAEYHRTSFADNDTIPVAMRPYVAYAAQKKYIGGKTVDGKLCFCPDEVITRAEAAVILSNIIGYAVQDTVTAFADADALPAWSNQALTSLRALGILLAPDGKANARDPMTRAETAAWLARTVQLMGG